MLKSSEATTSSGAHTPTFAASKSLLYFNWLTFSE